MKWSWSLCFILSISTTVMVGCGPTEDSGWSGDPGLYTYTDTGTRLFLRAESPQFLAYNRSLDNPSIINRVQRFLAPNEFDVNLPALLTEDGLNAAALVTGIGIDAVDETNTARAVKLGIVARRYDSSTGKFSNETRVFSPPRTTFEDAQRDFIIMNDNNPNFVMTGLALRGSRVRITNLVLQRKSLGNIFKSGSKINAKNFVEIESGWAAIGFLIAFPSSGDRPPFISDAIIHTAELIEE